ncbi:YraN family protein [Zoogloea sp.]|uniref:YraN family protein n=1 Tax=Zoogloea sp. TaxID=49181 RepID=UPI0031FBF59F
MEAWRNGSPGAGESDCGGGTPTKQAEHLRRGAAAEALAENYLSACGLVILARNVRCRGGEVDLIARDRGCIVFVEVRLRSNRRFGGAAASITATKQQRVILAARYWLAGAGRRHAAQPCRFDAVLLDSLEPPRLEWIRGAFDAG